MAFRMKHWIGLTILGLLLVSIWKLPPSVLELSRPEPALPQWKRAEALENDLRRTHEVVRQMRWADSLTALTVESAVDGLALGFPENNIHSTEEWGEVIRNPQLAQNGTVWIQQERKDLLRARIQDELAAMHPRSDMILGYFLQLERHGAVPGMESAPGLRGATYIGEHGGQQYCIQVQTDFWFEDRDLLSPNLRFTGGRTNAAGSCRPYLKHGMPGERIASWMEAGGLHFASLPAPPADPDYGAYRPTRHTYFGFGGFMFGYRNMGVEISQCMAGVPDGCLAAITDERFIGVRSGLQQYVVDNSPMVGPSERYGWLSPLGQVDDYLLADLEAEFGADAFSRFWHSDASVPEAFEAAFGLPMGEWLVDWAGISMDIKPPGPKLPRSAALGGLLAVSLFAALGGAWARRRRVG